MSDHARRDCRSINSPRAADQGARGELSRGPQSSWLRLLRVGLADQRQCTIQIRGFPNHYMHAALVAGVDEELVG